MNKNFFYATATLIGTIVGAGIFGIPYVVAQSGFLIGAVFLLVLTGIMVVLHLMYGEVVSRTEKKHRLVGYAGQYLGENWKKLVTFSLLIGLYGSILVYMIIGGNFLSILLSSLLGGSTFIYSLIFFTIGAVAVLKGIGLVKKLELVMTVFLLLIIFLIFFSGLFHLQISNLRTINLNKFFLPYGVILWALAGRIAIPEIKEVLKTDGRKYKKVIILGSIIPAILYFLFTFAVVGVAGKATSPEAIEGLRGFLGNDIIVIGAIFGFLAVMTSFFVLGLCLKKVFWYDYKINKNLSWLLVCFVPLLAFLLGLREFIPIIGFLGVIFGAIEGTTVILVYRKAKKFGQKTPEYSLRIPDIFSFVLIGIFILGLVYQIFYFIK